MSTRRRTNYGFILASSRPPLRQCAFAGFVTLTNLNLRTNHPTHPFSEQLSSSQYLSRQQDYALQTDDSHAQRMTNKFYVNDLQIWTQRPWKHIIALLSGCFYECPNFQHFFEIRNEMRPDWVKQTADSDSVIAERYRNVYLVWWTRTFFLVCLCY